MPDIRKKSATRIKKVYELMQKRFSEKRDKRGRIIRYRQDVPFTLAQFAEFVDAIFHGAVISRCCYCERPIDLLSFVTDHDVPTERGGSLELSNLKLCCSDCNKIKGSLTGQEFMQFMKGLRTFPESAQKDILKRLRSGAMGMRMRFFPRDKAKSETPEVSI